MFAKKMLHQEFIVSFLNWKGAECYHFRWYKNLIKEKHACLFFVSVLDCEFVLQKLPSL